MERVTMVSSVVFFVVYLLLFLWPQLARIGDIFAKMGETKAYLETIALNVARIDQFRHKVEAYKNKISSYEKRLPAEREIPALLEDLSNMAKTSGIKILSITPVVAPPREGRARKDQIYQEMPIMITAKSGYHELGQFLASLENASRLMKVVDIDIKANKATPRKHDVELVVSTFILLKERAA
jgi:type IV pilus assembly protein PilO